MKEVAGASRCTPSSLLHLISYLSPYLSGLYLQSTQGGYHPCPTRSPNTYSAPHLRRRAPLRQNCLREEYFCFYRGGWKITITDKGSRRMRAGTLCGSARE